jgi:hypothetical protein
MKLTRQRISTRYNKPKTLVEVVEGRIGGGWNASEGAVVVLTMSDEDEFRFHLRLSPKEARALSMKLVEFAVVAEQHELESTRKGLARGMKTRSVCSDSPTGGHEFVEDYEYDQANPPTVCEHCGVHKGDE